MPATAAPMAVEVIGASATGKSWTRSAPNRSTRPDVVPNTPALLVVHQLPEDEHVRAQFHGLRQRFIDGRRISELAHQVLLH